MADGDNVEQVRDQAADLLIAQLKGIKDLLIALKGPAFHVLNTGGGELSHPEVNAAINRVCDDLDAAIKAVKTDREKHR